ncbi:MAG: sulfatase [Bacteroidales bacterium]|nr:sulfatase [Bacteroidales bacterium]
MNRIKPLALTAPIALSACNGTPDKPNIVFFLIDDYGWTDSSVQYGEQLYPYNLRFNTPNMQRLAGMGVVMGNAYACPVSTPTRACMMSGMNAARIKVTNFTSLEKDKPSDAIGGAPGSVNPNESDIFANPEWNHNGICPAAFRPDSARLGLNHTAFVTPVVQLLKDAGYFTVHAGKAHWAPAGTPGTNPYNYGFAVNIAGGSNGHPRSYLGADNYGNTKDLWDLAAIQNMVEYYGTDVNLTEALTREALKALDYPVRHNQPFYLYMSHHGTHTPIQRDERFVQKYLDAGMSEKEARYASMVESVDWSLGQIMQWLEERGVADNTVILFMSDNGGQSVGSAKGGEDHTQNLPLREGKASVYEGGIRVPMIFYWPGRTKARRENVPAMPEDIFPTLLDIAGVRSFSTVQTIDGVSLLPTFLEGSPIDRDLVFHYPHQWRVEDQEDIDFLSAIRRGDWKLVYRMHTGALELYNLKEDIGERHDVSAEHPDVVQSLAAALSSRLKEWDASMPIVRESGLPVPMPDANTRLSP